MSKKDDRIAELEAENARLHAEIARLSAIPVLPYMPTLGQTNRCGLCGAFLNDGYGPIHQCWQWTCTSATTTTYAVPDVTVIGIVGSAA